MKKSYLKLFRGSCFMACFLALGSFSANAQTEHRITNDAENSLETFIENTAGWAPGDVIILASTGTYEVNDPISITQDVTIIGDPTLSSRPVVHFKAPTGFMPAADGLSLVFDGFDMEGIYTDANNDEQRSSVLEYGRRVAFGAELIQFQDVKATGFAKGIELNYDSWQTYESLIINDVVFEDITGWVLDPRLNALVNARITNSTFLNVGGFLKNPYFNKDERPVIQQQIVINRNSFYQVAGGSGALLQVNDPNDGSINLTFSNNIVSTVLDPENARPFIFNDAAGVYTINNNVFYNFESTRNEGIHNLAVVETKDNVVSSDNLTVDPAFADPAAGDLSLPEDSELLTASSSDGPIGDPSWTGEEEEPVFTPGERAHVVTNDAENSLETFIENTAGWAAGDTILLSSTGTYEINDEISISQDVTIMADPRLSSRPIIHFKSASGFAPSADGLSMVFKGFDMNGTYDNAGAEGRSTILEYGNNGFGAELIHFEDIKATGFNKGIELTTTNWRIYEEIIINNVIWEDITLWAFDPRLNAVKDVQITNSTFHNIGGFLKNPYFAKNDNEFNANVIAQRIVINRNTFYEVGRNVGGADAFIQVNDPTDNSVVLLFNNNIVSTLIDNANARPFRINAAAGAFEFNNNVFHNFESTRGEGAFNLASVDAAQENITTSNILNVDPAFVTPAEGDFTLPEDSELLTASTTEGPVGDPRWTGEIVDPNEPQEPEIVLVTSINISGMSTGVDPQPSTEILSPNGALNLSATVLPGSATDRTITWSLDDESLATLENPQGTSVTLRAVSSGTVTVTATANDTSGVVGTFVVTIDNQIPLQGISVSTEDGETEDVVMAVDESMQMEVTLNPADTDTPEVTWSVDNNYNNTSGEATISEDGILTAVAPGEVRVNATSDFRGGIRGRMVVTITDGVTAIGPDVEIATVYPNPAGDIIHINAATKVEVSVTTVTGTIVRKGIVNGRGTFNLAGLQKGLYVVLVKSGKDVQSLKLIKE